MKITLDLELEDIKNIVELLENSSAEDTERLLKNYMVEPNLATVTVYDDSLRELYDQLNNRLETINAKTEGM